MSGFLDKKKRFIDYKLTENGRNQMSSGDIRFKYYTFSDRSIVYESKFEKPDISDSEFYFLPYEATTDPGLYTNPEYYLTNAWTFNNVTDNFFVLRTTQKTLVENLKSKQILSEKKFTNANIESNNSFVFDSIDVKNDIDFTSTTRTLKYPTVKFLRENVENLKPVKKDLRFKDFLKFKFLPPQNIDGTQINDNAEETSENNIEFILKTLDIKNNILEEDTSEDVIAKVINTLEKSDKVFKFSYDFNNMYLKSNDLFHFEMHKVNSDNSLEKISFIKLGKNFDKSKNRFIEVYLIGKFIENNKVNEIMNSENNTLKRKVIDDYHFVNLFTLVVE